MASDPMINSTSQKEKWSLCVSESDATEYITSAYEITLEKENAEKKTKSLLL